MTFGEDRPAAGDLTRAVLARARSKIAVGLADEAYRGALWSVLRTELGESVTRVSSFVLALLEHERLSLDDLVWMIEPARAWPHHLEKAGQPSRRPTLKNNAVLRNHRRRFDLRFRHGLTFHLPDGSRLRLHVVEESLEIAGLVNGVGVRTRRGSLRLSIPGTLPLSTVQECIGRQAEGLIDLHLLTGRDWPVIGLEPSPMSQRWTAIVKTGTSLYKMPWTR